MISLSAYMFIMGGVMLAVRIGVVEFQMVRAGGLRVPRINRPSAVPAHAAPAGDAERQASGGGGEALQAIIRRRMAAEGAYAGSRWTSAPRRTGQSRSDWTGDRTPEWTRSPLPACVT